jgi:hypothetical protein
MRSHKPALVARFSPIRSLTSRYEYVGGGSCDHECNPDAVVTHFVTDFVLLLSLCLSLLTANRYHRYTSGTSKLNSVAENGHEIELAENLYIGCVIA